MKTIHELAEACGDVLVDIQGDPQGQITDLTNDSRRVVPGSLFIAICGEQADGRDYIPQAIAKGAAAVLYKSDTVLSLTVPAIRVSDDYVACGRVAECYHDFPARQMLKVGITGTNGKTTTAFLLRAIFRAAGRKVGLVGTVCYDLGDREIPADRTTPTPLELQAMLAEMRAAGVRTLIMEVSSHALCQGRVGTMCFDAAAFSNLTPEHLDYHKDMENYYQAKKLLFTRFLKRGGAMIVNVDDEYGQRLERELEGRLVTYGLSKHAEFRPKHWEMNISGTELELPCGNLRSPLIGRYNAFNVLCAAACAWACGIGQEDICQAIESFAGVPGRLQRVPSSNDLNVFVDYAHTGDALENVLNCLKPLCQKRLTVVFGCGGNRDRTKRPVMGRIAAELADRVIVTSDNPRNEEPEAIIADILAGIPAGIAITVEPDRRRAIEQAITEAEPGDTILLAGKGHEDYQEIRGVKHPYSDLDTALTALRTRSAPVSLSA